MTDQSRKIRWGVLGYARIAREFVIPAMQRSSNSEFHALGSRDEAKLAEVRARFNAPRAYRGYDDVLRDPEVDAIYIPLPNSLHREWVIKAADRGKPVLCEKPIALNAAECREMTAACAANGVPLMEAFMYRYTVRTRQVIEVLRSGVLGEVKQLRSTFRFLLTNPASIKLRPELGGGALYDIGCYVVNFFGWVMDEILGGAAGAARPISMSAECERAGGIDMAFSALLKYPSGLLATLDCGLNSHRRVVSEIVGTKAVLEIPDTFFDSAGVLTLTVGEQRRKVPVPASDRYRLEIEDFADAILNGRPPELSLAETQRNMEVIDRLFAAVK